MSTNDIAGASRTKRKPPEGGSRFACWMITPPSVLTSQKADANSASSFGEIRNRSG
jgi:hypothetical protein